MKPVAIIVALGAMAQLGCYSPKINAPEPEEDPLAGTQVDPVALAAMNKPPPPKNQTDPDMDFIRDMTRRGGEQAQLCAVPDNAGPRGTASVSVTYGPNGHVTKVLVLAPHANTPIGDCIRRAFEPQIVTGWQGEPVTIDQKVELKDRQP